MLVLARKTNQSVDLFDERTGQHLARITVLDKDDGHMRIGVDAVSNIKILRTELLRPTLSNDIGYEVGTV